MISKGLSPGRRAESAAYIFAQSCKRRRQGPPGQWIHGYRGPLWRYVSAGRDRCLILSAKCRYFRYLFAPFLSTFLYYTAEERPCKEGRQDLKDDLMILPAQTPAGAVWSIPRPPSAPISPKTPRTGRRSPPRRPQIPPAAPCGARGSCCTCCGPAPGSGTPGSWWPRRR